MTRSSSGHGHARILIALALTGFAYVAAGIRTNRRIAKVPRMPVVSDWRQPESAVPAPATALLRPEPAMTTATAGLAVEPPSPARPEPEIPAAEEVCGPSNSPDSFDAVMSRVDALIEKASRRMSTQSRMTASVSASSPSRPTDPGHDHLDSAPADVASGGAMFLARSGQEPGVRSPEPVRPMPRSNEVPARHQDVLPVTTGPEDAMTESLRRVGLDGSMIATVSEGLRRGTGLEALLLQVFAPLGTAPALPRQAGSLLVVVGDGVPARRLAAALAGDMGTDPAGVPFASLDTQAHMVATGPLLVRSAEDAGERAPGWRRSQAAVVVVDASMTGADRSWATHLIAALRPTAVWGVVEATAKTEDIASWITDLGGVNALALEHLDATVSPAAVLGLGAPVARIDGQPATAARWVATVVDRIKQGSETPVRRSRRANLILR